MKKIIVSLIKATSIDFCIGVVRKGFQNTGKIRKRMFSQIAVFNSQAL